MAHAAGYSEHNGVEVPQPANVNKVCQQFMVAEDGCFAERLQSNEFEQKYDLNRFHRRTVRGDIPVARVVQTEEDVRQQHERMEQLWQNSEIMAVDEDLAAKFRENERQAAELVRKKRSLEDSVIAQQLLQEDMIKEEFQRSETQRNDEKVARQLQEKERKRYELKKRERDLAKQRKHIEQEQLQRACDPQVMLAGYRMENLGGRQMSSDMASMDLSAEPSSRVLRTDGRVEDVGDFTDFYVQPDKNLRATEKKSLQELQDEELARLLQDQEHKRGAKVNRSKLREIEDKDAELAQIIHEEEKLKAQKRHKKRVSRQQSSTPSQTPSQPDETGQQQAPHGELTRGYAHSLVDRENNLKEHRAPLPAYQDPPAYPEGRPLPETPTYANIGGSLQRPYSQTCSSSDNEDIRPIPRTSHGNVFASVDPTYRKETHSMGRQNVSPQESNTMQHNTSPNSGSAVTLRGDETYSNVDDMRNTGPVQAQRRSTSKRGKKSDKSGCLLQ